ncbi:MAG: hypothetical protein JWO06_637 [Bacteroidota bacterium]|nr:hypothetical protein [Bacteroidota bacterium]
MEKRQKTGGRRKGSCNKITIKTRQFLAEVFDTEIRNFPKYIAELDTREKLDFCLRLAPYILPKIANISISVDDQKDKIITLHLGAPGV